MGLLLIAAIAWYSDIGWSSVQDALGRFSPTGLFLIAMAQGALIMLAAWKWVIIYRGMNDEKAAPRFADAMGATAIGATLGVILHAQVVTPLVRAWIARRRNLSPSLAIGTSLYEQIFEVSILVTMAALSALIYFAGLDHLVGAALAALFLAIITALLAPGFRFAAWCLRLLQNSVFAKPSARLADGMVVAARLPWTVLAALNTLSALRYLVMACLHVLILDQILDGAPLEAMVLAFPLVLFVLSVPVTPAGLGLFEAAWIGVLIANGVPAPDAAAATIALRVVTVIGALAVAPLQIIAMSATAPRTLEDKTRVG